MMNMRKFVITITVLLLNSIPVFSQTQDPSRLTLERIFSTEEFEQDEFGPARWLEDGSGYTTLEESQRVSGGEDIIKYDPLTGRREVLVSAELLIPGGETEPLEIEDYLWSPDGKMLMIFTNTRKVWRDNTRGDYWILNLETGRIKKLGGRADPSTLMFATFSPDSRKVCYVCLNNIYLEDIVEDSIKRLTSDGSRTIINGTFDWVYEEELGLQNGFRWSPDSRKIAFWQLDAEGVGEFYMVNNTDSIYSKIIPVQYPKVGTTNSAGKIGVVEVDNGEITWMDVPGDPRNNYIARMDWAANSRELIAQQLNRIQNTNNLILCNSASGEVRTVIIERDDAWLEVVDDLHWINGGSEFTWISERDGWQHVYMISRSGENVRLITGEEFDVISIESIDIEGGWLFFIASPEDPSQRYLYRKRINGRGNAERLSPADQPGTHSYQISQDSKWAFHTYSSFDTPPVIELINLPDHDVVRTFVDNADLKEIVNSLRRRKTVFSRVDIGEGVEFDYWIMKPHNFNSEKKYPLLFFVYGEPAGQTVLDRWSGNRYLWHLFLTQNEYIVASIDNRGTPAPRGREWRKSVYRQIGILASKDQAAAAGELMRKFDYIDKDRIGIWGWSGGGSMSLNMIFRYPDMYHTAMSVAPVGNQRFYDTIYQERYMDLPDDNVEGFRDGSPVTFAHQLEGNLLIVHGTGDDNVHYQNAEAVINRLIEHNKYFTMMAYPNRTHSIKLGENTRRHLYELLTRYLRENLKPGPENK